MSLQGMNKVITDWESANLTQEDCADLAAYGNLLPKENRTNFPLKPFWTYSQSKNRCWLKLSRSNIISGQNVVSGNRKCGGTYTDGKTQHVTESQMFFEERRTS